MEDIGTIVSLMAILAIPFMLGICAGVEITNRRKADLRSQHEQLGRDINQMFADMATSFKWIGAGSIQRSGEFERDGVKCRLLFIAEKAQ